MYQGGRSAEEVGHRCLCLAKRRGDESCLTGARATAVVSTGARALRSVVVRRPIGRKTRTKKIPRKKKRKTKYSKIH